MPAKTYTLKELACLAGVILPLIGGAGYLQGSGSEAKVTPNVERLEIRLHEVDSSVNSRISRLDSTIRIQRVLDSIDRSQAREKTDTLLAGMRRLGAKIEQRQFGEIACNELNMGRVARSK